MATPLLRAMSLGEVLDISFGIYRSHFVALLLIAAFTQVIPVTLGFFVPDFTAMALNPLLGLLWLIAKIVMTALGVAACTLVVSGAYLGREVEPFEALRSSLPLIGRLILISFATGLVVFFGLIFLFIPGLILYAGLVLAPVAAVLESPISANNAMSRSWALTKGQRFKIWAAVMVPWLLLLVPGIAVGTLVAIAAGAAVSEGNAQLMVQILTALITIFFYPYLYVVIAVCYYDQRIRKEGFDLELLAGAIPAE